MSAREVRPTITSICFEPTDGARCDRCGDDVTDAYVYTTAGPTPDDEPTLTIVCPRCG